MNAHPIPEEVARLPVAARIPYRQETIILHVAASAAGRYYTTRTTVDCLPAPRCFHPSVEDAVNEAARYVDSCLA